jgi:hypothetical protein
VAVRDIVPLVEVYRVVRSEGFAVAVKGCECIEWSNGRK